MDHGHAGRHRVLQAYRIDGPREALVTSADEAVQWAEQVRLSGRVEDRFAAYSAQVRHRRGGARSALRLRRVRVAFERIMTNARRASAEARIDGVTIQPMLRAGQEVIIGAVRDEQFGPLIMFGAGGVEVEGQRDVAFGLAPLSRAEAEKMIDATFAGKTAARLSRIATGRSGGRDRSGLETGAVHLGLSASGRGRDQSAAGDERRRGGDRCENQSNK